jgi:hypothetical protein
MVWYGHSYVTAGITLDDVVIILSSRPRKPIPAGGRAHFTQLALMLAHTGSHVPSTLGIVMLFKLHTSVTITKVQSTSVLRR